MRKLAPSLNQISKERIMVELDKLIVSNHPENIYIAYECGITKYIMPEFDKMMETAQNTPYHIYSVGEHTIKVMEHCEKEHYLRWAALFHDIGKPDSRTTDENGIDHFYGHAAVSAKIAKDILKRLKSDNKTIEYVTKIVACHSDGLKSEEMTEKSLRRQINRIGVDIYPYFLKIRRADLLGKSDLGYEKGIHALCYMEETYPKIIQAGNALCLKDLAVNGSDLIQAGFKPGKELGDILNKLLMAVVDEPDINTKEKLIELAKNV
jgi:tRNA nucleotidyltransferase (CCA-adding enzyme)